MLNWFNKKRNRKGFTLVELVVVIAILGILAAIAVPKLSKSREAAQVAAHNANVRTLESAGNMYLVEFPDGTDEKELKGDELNSYLQKPLTIPKALVGKTFDGVNNEGEPTQIVIKNDDVYAVTINYTEGTITVTPGLIVPKSEDN